MTAFDDQFAAEAGPALLGAMDGDFSDLGEFGEVLIYRPLNGRPRPIKGMVDRGPPEPVPHGTLAPLVTIEVYNDGVYGIESRCLDTGGDAIDVALWPGKTPVTLSIKKRLSQSDNGLLKLECG